MKATRVFGRCILTALAVATLGRGGGTAPLACVSPQGRQESPEDRALRRSGKQKARPDADRKSPGSGSSGCTAEKAESGWYYWQGRAASALLDAHRSMATSEKLLIEAAQLKGEDLNWYRSVVRELEAKYEPATAPERRSLEKDPERAYDKAKDIVTRFYTDRFGNIADRRRQGIAELARDTVLSRLEREQKMAEVAVYQQRASQIADASEVEKAGPVGRAMAALRHWRGRAEGALSEMGRLERSTARLLVKVGELNEGDRDWFDQAESALETRRDSATSTLQEVLEEDPEHAYGKVADMVSKFYGERFGQERDVNRRKIAELARDTVLTGIDFTRAAAELRLCVPHEERWSKTLLKRRVATQNTPRESP